jgi:hypothetical protein
MNSIVEVVESAYASGSLRIPARLLLEFVERLGNSALRQFDERSDYVQWDRPSGWSCGRKKACVKHELPAAPMSFRTVSTFMDGDYHEARLVLLALAAGVPLERAGAAQLTLQTSLGTGHPDGTVWGGVFEAKSMSDYSWQRFVGRQPRICVEEQSINAFEDTFGYRTQSNAYAFAAVAAGLIAEPLIRVVAVNKMTSQLAERLFRGDLELLQVRAQDRAAIAASATPWDLPPIEPEQDSKGRLKLPVQCRYCDFQAPCLEAQGKTTRFDGKVTWVLDK